MKECSEKAMNKYDLWIVEHFSELVANYAGKYVAVVNEKLVAVGRSGKEVEDKAKEVEPHKIPSVLHVPREEDMACLLYRIPLHPPQRISDANNSYNDTKDRNRDRMNCASTVYLENKGIGQQSG